MEVALINVPIYNWSIQFVRKAGIRKTIAFLKEQDFYDDLGDPRLEPLGRTWRNSASPVTIWVKDHTNRTVLTHEMFHAAFFILEQRGMELKGSSEEAYTYLMDFIQEAYDKAKWKTIK